MCSSRAALLHPWQRERPQGVRLPQTRNRPRLPLRPPPVPGTLVPTCRSMREAAVLAACGRCLAGSPCRVCCSGRTSARRMRSSPAEAAAASWSSRLGCWSGWAGGARPAGRACGICAPAAAHSGSHHRRLHGGRVWVGARAGPCRRRGRRRADRGRLRARGAPRRAGPEEHARHILKQQRQGRRPGRPARARRQRARPCTSWQASHAALAHTQTGVADMAHGANCPIGLLTCLRTSSVPG